MCVCFLLLPLFPQTFRQEQNSLLDGRIEDLPQWTVSLPHNVGGDVNPGAVTVKRSFRHCVPVVVWVPSGWVIWNVQEEHNVTHVKSDGPRYHHWFVQKLACCPAKNGFSRGYCFSRGCNLKADSPSNLYCTALSNLIKLHLINWE